MDPIHLEPDEIDHELWIRGITELDQQHERVKTGRLREIFTRENIGVLVAPGVGTSPFEFNVDVQYCDRVCDQVRQLLAEGVLSKFELELLLTRMLHVTERLPRLVIQNLTQAETIQTATTNANGIIQTVRERLSAVHRGASRPNTNTRVPPVSQQQPPPPPHLSLQLPALHRRLNRASIYDDFQPLARAEATPNINNIPLAQELQRVAETGAPPQAELQRASSLQNLGGASALSPLPQPQSVSAQTNIMRPTPNQYISAPVRPNETVSNANQYVSNPNAAIRRTPSIATAVTMNSQTATTTTVTSATAEPPIFHQRRSTGFWDGNTRGVHQWSQFAPEFFPRNRPSLFSDIQSNPSNINDPFIDMTTPNIARSNGIQYNSNAVRFAAATSLAPRAPVVDFTIPDSYDFLNKYNDESSFNLARRPMRTALNDIPLPNNTRVFPYTHNLQPVPIYIDTPYRADAGFDYVRTNNN